jgi:hypothetical protein
VRAAVADAATIVTQAANVPYFERAFAQRNSLLPDRMLQSGKTPSFIAVGETRGLPSTDSAAAWTRCTAIGVVRGAGQGTASLTHSHRACMADTQLSPHA